MPHDHPEAGDPMQLVGCGAPGDLEHMAEAIVDEYLRFGFDRDRLLAMFREPFFAMTHAVWRHKGDAWCEALIARVAARWTRSE